jgi:hypothetical protein
VKKRADLEPVGETFDLGCVTLWQNLQAGILSSSNIGCPVSTGPHGNYLAT